MGTREDDARADKQPDHGVFGAYKMPVPMAPIHSFSQLTAKQQITSFPPSLLQANKQKTATYQELPKSFTNPQR
jgi:hypothetical protein